MLGRRGKKVAFTLVEILAVVVILGILAAVVVPRVLATSSTAKINSCYHNKVVINAAAEQWHFNTGAWPDHLLNDIGQDKDYFPDGVPVCQLDSAAYHLDHTTHRVSNHVH